MARTKGTYSLPANIEVLAGAPLDARDRVATKADLTASGTFPYPYIGMETYVVSEGKKYVLTADDPTQVANWSEVGSGGGAVEGYYNTTDGLFYKENTYTTAIPGAASTLYIDLATNKIYRYNGSAFILTPALGLTIAADSGTSALDLAAGTKYKITVGPDTFIFKTPSAGISGSGTSGYIPKWNGASSLTDLVALSSAVSSQTQATKFLREDGTWSAPSYTSIPSNNVTGSGTNGYITKWNGTNTITDLVALSSAVSSQTQSTKFLREDGTWSAPSYTTNTDEKVKQENTTGSDDYRVLLSNGANDTTETKTARKSTNLKFNPSTGVLSTSKAVLSKTLKRMLTGTGTAGQDKGSGVANRYVPSEWVFNAGITPEEGDEIIIKIPVAGISYGEWLSVDNGTTYYPVGPLSTSRLGTQFAVDYSLHLIFRSNANFSMYARGGADSSTTYTGNYWQVLNFRDTNDNTVPSAYCTTAAGTAAKSATCTEYVLTSNTYLHVLIKNANTSASALTLNVNSKGAKPIYINGSASSSSNYTLPAGTYIVFYNGTNYYFRTDGVAPIKALQVADIGSPTNTTTFAYSKSGLNYSDYTWLAAWNGYELRAVAKTQFSTTDTKNTAGSTNSTSKLFLIGATSQAANPQTYSNSLCYETNGELVTTSVTVGGNAANTSGARMKFDSTTNSVNFVFVS